MATLPGLVVNLTLNSAQFSAGINRANQQLGALNKTANVLKGAFVGFLGALSVQQLTQLGRGALEAAGNLGEMAQQAGVTARQLQILTVAGLQAGVSQEQLITSLGQFGRRVGEAAQGSGKLRDTLAQYNIAVKTAEGNTRASVEVLGDLAEAVRNAANDQERLRIASEAFGSRIGTRLIPLLSQGREGFEAWAVEAEKAGLIMGDALISKADQAADSIATLEKAFTTGFQIGFIETFADSVSSGTEAIQQMREAGTALAQVLGTAFLAAAVSVKFLADNFRVLATAVGVFIAFRLVQTVLPLIGLMYEFAKALRAAAAAQALLSVAAFRFGKILLPVVAAIIAGLVVYEALGGELDKTTQKLTKFFEEATGGGLVVLTEDAENAAEKFAKLRTETLEAAKAQLELRNVLLGAGTTEAPLDLRADPRKQLEDIEQINREFEVQNKLREAGVPLQKALESGLKQQMLDTAALTAENEKLLGVLQERLALRGESEQAQLLLKFNLQETEEYQKQLVLLRLKQQFGEAAASTALTEAEAWARVTQELKQRQAALDLARTISQQELLLRYQGKETEQYRIQLRLLQLRRENIDITPQVLRNVATLERQATQLEKISKVQDSLAKGLQNAFETAWTNIQNLSTETFEKIYRGGITTFGDLAEAIKDIFIRLAAEISTLLVFRAATASTAGAIGAGGSLAQALGFAPAAAAAGGAAPLAATGLAGWQRSLAGGPAAFGTPQIGGWREQLATGPVAPPGIGLSQLLLSGALGFAGGGLLGGFFGGKGQLGGGIGGGLGAAGGAALGSTIPGVGTVAGALAGGLLGGLGGGFLGGLFGGEEANTGKLRFRSQGAIGGPFGGIDISGEESFAGPLRALVKSFDEGVAQFLTARQETRITKTLQELDRFSERLPEDDPSKGFKAILRERARVVLREAGLSTGIIKGAGVEEIGQRVGTALQTQAAVKELTRANNVTAQFAKQIADINEKFATLTKTAKQFGISTEELARARWEEIQAIKAQQKAQRTQVQLSVAEAVRGNTLGFQIAQIKARFAELTQTAKEWGVSTKGLSRAQWEAVQAAKAQAKAVKDQVREQIASLALQVIDPFRSLIDPLKSFQQQLSFANLNPAGQFKAAEEDFRRIAKLALAGNISAIQQFQGAAELFIAQSEQFGASPAGAAARTEVAAITSQLIDKVNKAQQDASKGIADEIKKASRAEVDTLKELIAEVGNLKEEIKKLKR